ncbi:hypothetical protein FRX31_015746 [Thalictrum thalictroides]|uniref:F-box domain-containing protein n=1 Tax=Thalictrum thalictroides TaxID=46969 RepID=A0A7J6WCG1_THATH|nr:hypothetical protein FRX31_015746 [Thalictrum thalictroides]
MNSSNSLPFPNDLIIEILTRLPIKPLFRFKCVSKEWQDMISVHLSMVLPNTTGFYIMVNSTIASEPGNIKFINVHPNGFIMSSSSDSVIEMTNLDFIQQSFIILDSNKGFLLLEERKITFLDDEQPSQYLVCNPLTKQCISLPKPKYGYNREKTSLFCYKDDNYADQHHIDFQVICYNGLVTEIYSSKTRLWVESETGPRSDGRKIFFSECVYWLEECGHSSRLFSSNGGGIRGINFPCAKQSTYYEQLLGVSGESLYFADSNKSRFMVWSLVNGVDWCMKHHITFQTVIYPEVDWITEKHPFIPLAFHPLNYQLVLVVMNNRLVMYLMDEKRIELVNELQNEFFPSTYRILRHRRRYIRNVSIFPFSPALLSTCTPCIEDT